MEVERIYESLISLWAKRGATPPDIRDEPALMELGYVIARAARRVASASPPPQAVAEECRRCIAEASQQLPVPTSDQPLFSKHNHAEAARIIIGVAQGTKGTTSRFRRDMVKSVLEMSEDQIAHIRPNRRLTYEQQRLYDIAEVLATWAQDGPPLSYDDAIAAMDFEAEREFDVVDYHAVLTVHPIYEDEMTVTESLVVKAICDNARWFVFIDSSRSYQNGVIEEVRATLDEGGRMFYARDPSSPSDFIVQAVALPRPYAVGETERLNIQTGYAALLGGFTPHLQFSTLGDTPSSVELEMTLHERMRPVLAAQFSFRSDNSIGARKGWKVEPDDDGTFRAAFSEMSNSKCQLWVESDGWPQRRNVIVKI